MDIPYVIVERSTVDSTQDVAAAEFAARGRPVLVVAARQRAGRGRIGRPWWNADRAVACSFAFTPPWPTEDWPLVPLVAALAARDAVAETCRRDVELKWPNDLVVPEGKVGGLLAEGTDGRLVVGLGVNLWWADPPSGAAGLCPTDPGPRLGPRLARRWVDGLLRRLARPPREWGHDEYRAVCSTIGSAVTWRRVRGRAIDVSSSGALLIETPEGVVEVTAGDVFEGAATMPGTAEKGGDG